MINETNSNNGLCRYQVVILFEDKQGLIKFILYTKLHIKHSKRSLSIIFLKEIYCLYGRILIVFTDKIFKYLVIV